MATVQMPDGTTVEMPDQLDPALGSRLRAFNDAHNKPPATPPTPAAEAKPGPAQGPQSIGDRISGAVNLLTTGALNTIPSVIESARDLVSGGTATPLGRYPYSPEAQRLASDVKNALPKGNPNNVMEQTQKIKEGVMGPPSDLSQAITGEASRVGGDLLNIGSVAAPMLKAGEAVLPALESTEAAAPIAHDAVDEALKTAGYKNLPRQGEGSTVARAGAKVTGEPTLAQQQTLHNQEVDNVFARHEAGVPQDSELNAQTVKAARKAGPGQVYDAAKASLPGTLTQDGQLQSDLKGVGDTTSQLPRSPDVDALKSFMLNQPEMTNDQLFSNIQQARQKASRLHASENPDDQAMGDAYKGVADAYEDFVGRQLDANPNSTVSLADWQKARTAFAKNYAVEAAIQGKAINGAAIARQQIKNPDQLTGGLRLIAEQHNRYPLSSGFGPKTFAPDGAGASGSTEGAIARHVTGPALGAGIGSLFGGPIGATVGGATGLVASNALQAVIRRALGGTPELGAAAGREALTNPRMGNFFDQEAPPQREQLPPSPGPIVTGRQEAPGGGDLGGDISLADLLSHGVEQEPKPGLSAGPMGAPPAEGVPFSRNVEHEAGGLSLQHEPTLAELLMDLHDHPDVMSQGVPEGIMQRTPAKGGKPLSAGGLFDELTNNASGESSASVEAINRDRIERAQGRDRFLVDEDGKVWPIRGVDAVDFKAPRGSLIIQKGIGDTPYTILDRGGLPRSHAQGLLNRALGGGTGLTLADMLEGGGG